MRYVMGAVVGAVLMAGCTASGGNAGVGGSDGPQGSTSSAVSFCDGYCARVNSCDTTRDEQTCSDACANENAATFPKLRQDVVSLISQCIDEKDCKTILSSNVLSTCADEAAAAVAPTQLAVDFCDSYGAASAKCGSHADKAACLTRAKLYNDSALG